MPPDRKLLPYVATLVPGLGWMIPMFTQLHKRYPSLENIVLHGVGLGLLLGAVCAAIVSSSGGFPTQSRKSTIGQYAFLFFASLVTGTMWAPCLNGLLDFGKKRVVDGEVEVIETPGKGNPSRIVKATVDGEDLEGSFYPHDHFWHVANVRDGGKVRLTVGSGFLGVTWIAKFEDR